MCFCRYFVVNINMHCRHLPTMLTSISQLVCLFLKFPQPKSSQDFSPSPGINQQGYLLLSIIPCIFSSWPTSISTKRWWHSLTEDLPIGRLSFYLYLPGIPLRGCREAAVHFKFVSIYQVNPSMNLVQVLFQMVLGEGFPHTATLWTEGGCHCESHE